MGFYDLTKQERVIFVNQLTNALFADFKNDSQQAMLHYFEDEDTYVRKNAYLAVGRIYSAEVDLRPTIRKSLYELLKHEDEKVRQTVVNAAGEIGLFQFQEVQHFFDIGLTDAHHRVRNAVIGSVKKMAQKNPKPVLAWCENFVEHEDKEIRRQICHGIELRGRTHPEDVLPLLKKFQFDETARVSKTLIHVLGQIAYKKACLTKVIAHLQTWENDVLVEKALLEIIDVHDRYKSFAALSQAEAITYIQQHFKQVDL